jgi:hypothetical protein
MTLAPQPDNLSPDLLDLMEHEKTIEQGQSSMLDMGWAFEKIRDGRKYKAAGYSNFNNYCRDRWGITRSTVDRVIRACQLVAEMTPIGVTPPANEHQARKLLTKPRTPSKREHPAPFSDPILDEVADSLEEADQTGTVLDPFAGTGRVHELRDRLDNVKTVGVEIEPEWAAKHPDTIEGNALELTNTVEPDSIDAIVTSPTYGNRMADHHDAKDDSVRLTYKHSLGRDLHDDNSGQLQWGPEYRRFHQIAWAEAVAALKPGGTLTLNIKNHVRAGVIQRVAEWHANTLIDLGMRIDQLQSIPTRGFMAGENADRRAGDEYVIVFRKPDE